MLSDVTLIESIYFVGDGIIVLLGVFFMFHCTNWVRFVF